MFSDYNVDFVVETDKEKLGDAVAKHTKGYGAHGVICLAPSNEDIEYAFAFIESDVNMSSISSSGMRLGMWLVVVMLFL